MPSDFELTAPESGPPVVDYVCRACEHKHAHESDSHVDCCDGCVDCCECVSCEHRSCDWRGDGGDDFCSDCMMCSEHCTHWTCNGCDRRRDSDDESPCGHCEQCGDCCECRYCESCNDSHDRDRAWCSDGGDHCADSCEDCGNGERAVTLHQRAVKFYPPKRGQCKMNPSARMVSVEIEVATLNDASNAERVEDVCQKWKASIVEDGSLPATGFEINTSPAGGDLFVEQLTEIAKALTSAGAEVNSDCGLHVHVDCRDFAFYDMRRLVMLYARVEPVLFSMMPGSRRANNYCKPCGSKYLYELQHSRVPKDSKRQLLTNVHDEAPSRAMLHKRASKWGEFRYHALNLHSWLYRGSVECRLHTGSVNGRKIIAWGMLWAAIADTAMSLTEREIERLGPVNVPFERATHLLLDIAPTESVKTYITERLAQYASHGRPFMSMDNSEDF